MAALLSWLALPPPGTLRPLLMKATVWRGLFVEKSAPPTVASTATAVEPLPMGGEGFLNEKQSAWNGEFGGTLTLPIMPAATLASPGPGCVFWGVLLSFGYGSSMSNSASMEFPVPAPLPPSRRLVMLVLSDSRISVVGTGLPLGVGLPPVHCSNRSPMSSVMPSTRTRTADPALAVQLNACWTAGCCCAFAVPAPNNRATRANAKNNLRKSAISFSL